MCDKVRVSGKITHLFFHRFVVEGAQESVLADVTPHGIEKLTLAVGDEVVLEGEMKPSELKVTRLTRGGKTVDIHHKKKPHHPH